MGEISLKDLRVARVAFVSRVEVYMRRNAHACEYICAMARMRNGG